MWNSDKSLKLSLVITYVFMAALVAVVILLPWLVGLYVDYTGKNESLAKVIMAVCYICSPAAAVALLSLRRMLRNLTASAVFCESNVSMLRRLSWCCVFAGIVTLASGWLYLPFFLIGIAAVFFALILRILKNVFRSAIELKQENDMTI